MLIINAPYSRILVETASVLPSGDGIVAHVVQQLVEQKIAFEDYATELDILDEVDCGRMRSRNG